MLIHPQSELIREPRLLVPGMQPLGKMRLATENPFGRLFGQLFYSDGGGRHIDLVSDAIGGYYAGATSVLNYPPFMTKGFSIAYDRGACSHITHTPPLNITVVAVYFGNGNRVLSTNEDDAVLGGFCQYGTAVSSAWKGGNCAIALQTNLAKDGLEHSAYTTLTYSDTTTDTLGLAKPDYRSDHWFVAVSVSDAASVTLVAKNLTKNEYSSNTKTITKSLNSVAQKFCMAGYVPVYGSTSWSRATPAPIAYIGWMPYALTKDNLYALASDPYQIVLAA